MLSSHLRNLFIFAAFILFSGNGLKAAPTGQNEGAYHYYMKALIYESQGNLAGAQAELDKAIEIEPESPHLRHMDAEISFFLGQLERAKNSVEKANKLDPKNTKAHILAGQIYWALGDVESAEKKLQKAVTLSPDEPEPLVSLAMAVTSRDPQKAIDLYKNFLEHHPGEVEIQERLGQLYRSQGDLPNAKKSWEKVLEWSPDSLRAHLALAQIAEVNTDTSTAISHYQAVLNKDPSNLPLLLRVGELQYRSNAMAEAYQAFSQARKISPDSSSANFWMALLHEHRGEWDQAIELLNKVSAKAPETGVMLRLSYYYTQAGKQKEAIQILKALSDGEPENTDFLNYLAVAYEQDKNFSMASKTLERLVDIDPYSPEYRFYYATLLDRLNKFPKAEIELKKAIELKPEYAMALNYLGYSYADRDIHLKEAEDYLLRAVKLEPEKSAFLDSLGWVYFRLGQLEKAKNYLQKAAATGYDPLIWEHLGDVQQARGDLAAAILAWDESLRSKAKQPKVNRKLKKALKKLSPSQKLSLFVKRGIASYSDLKSLNGLIEIEVCQGRPCFKNRGQISFSQEGDLKIEIPGPLTGPILLVAKPKGKAAQYGALHPQFQSVEYYVTRAVTRLESLFSGNLFRSLEMANLKEQAQQKGRRLISDGDQTKITFEGQKGNLEKILWKEASEEIKLEQYKDDHWPSIPEVFEWKDTKEDFVIRLVLKGSRFSLATPSTNDQ